MKKGKSRPFTAPRPSKPVETGHRKDNAEWGKRMERELQQIEQRQTRVEEIANTSDDEDLPIASQLGTEKKGKVIEVMSQGDEDETPKLVEVESGGSDSEGDEVPIAQTRLKETKRTENDGVTKGNTEFIGVKVARDFGKQGIFVGEIVALEYDSGDEAKDDPFYVVKYTDGDQEDLDGKELSIALELYHKTQNQKGTKLVMDVVDTDDEAHEEDDSMCSGSDDEETYVPSPEVRISNGP
jgi:hypothetical protein